MSIFETLTGSSFGKLRDEMQQGFSGGSFSEGGKAAIKAFDPLISKERFANVLNNSIGGGDVFSEGTMGDQAGFANDVGKLYTLLWLGGKAGDLFGGGQGGAAGSGQGGGVSPPGGGGGMGGGMGWQDYAKMGAGMQGGGGGGGGQQQNNSYDQSLRLQQETNDYMRRRREEEQAQKQAELMANALRMQNGY